MKNSEKIRKLTTIAVLSALAYVAVLLFRIPIAPLDFLKYEPKDVIITIGGFIYGPAAAFGMSAAVSLIETATISTTGFWGFLMNVISTCAFACTASFIYKRKRTLGGALIGLGSGIILSTAMMLLWNWAITPIYMGYPRSAVAAMLLPALSDLFDFCERVLLLTDLPLTLFVPVVKVTAIALVARFSCALCADAGQSALSSLLAAAGTLCALVCALPLMEALLEMVEGFL